ncbi:Ubiquitin carboxyl-terminal hydrolase 16 [Modicella reniformis]|uniref:ubiquitinyl hydrolase 1 n=1 Tax=Modicella reniformis TaxID=1440133 RepID=A0A9P6LSF3_9FUNG|nr:Ubiquitin carboxyl-terminal hydrolase 16 [Modicella reniformis]
MTKKNRASKTKAKGASAGGASAGGARWMDQLDSATEEAILQGVIADSAELARIADSAELARIATVEESVLSGVIEASLQSSREDHQEPQQLSSEDNDIRLDAINEAQYATGTEKCEHIKDNVKQATFRRLITQIKDWDHCGGCRNSQKLAHKLDAVMPDVDLTDAIGDTAEGLPADALWMCMTCCELNCGRGLKKHAITHHRTKERDHPLAINLSSLDCWCYECDDQLLIPTGKNPIAQECQAILAKFLHARQTRLRNASIAATKKSKGATVPAAVAKAKVHAPGLQNLGNTCFFNSVMQVMTETKTLRTIFTEKDHPTFPPSLAAGTDTGLGPLTTTFKDFLFTMWKQQGGIVTPRDLFAQIAKKWRAFRGFREQDSQELMRHLFDGIREEEKDLIKKRSAGESTASTSPSEAVATSSAKYMPFIDSCFAGKLVSVIVCHSCKKCSYAYEDYFDLSLPIKGAPGIAGGSLVDVLRAKSRTSSFEISTSVDSDDKFPISVDDQGSEAHLKHVEKLLKNVSPQTDSAVLSIERSLNQFTSVDCLDDENKFACENCYNLIKTYGITAANDGNIGQSICNGVAKEEQQAEMESAVDETKIEPEDDEDDSKESASEPDTDFEALDGAASTGTNKEVESAAGVNTVQPAQEPYILRKAYKRYLISSLPPTLVLHLKRFERSTSRFGLMRKIDEHVEIPVEIDMSPYCIPQSDLVDEGNGDSDQDEKTRTLSITEIEANDKVSKKYRLYGATVHQGSLATGHYSNYVLSSKVDLLSPAVEKDKGSSSAPFAVASNGIELPDIPLSTMLARHSPWKVSGKKKGRGQAKTGAVDDTTTVTSSTSKQVSGETDKGPSSTSESVKESKGKESEKARQWIHCSDTHVRLATLQEVLNSRPYLVYYERCS